MKIKFHTIPSAQHLNIHLTKQCLHFIMICKKIHFVLLEESNQLGQMQSLVTLSTGIKISIALAWVHAGSET